MSFGIKLAWGAGDEGKGTLGAVELAVRDAKGVAGEDGIGALINNKNMVKGMAWRIPKMNLTRAKPKRECFRGFNNSGGLNGNHATVVTFCDLLGVDLADSLPEFAWVDEMAYSSGMNDHLRARPRMRASGVSAMRHMATTDCAPKGQSCLRRCRICPLC